MKMSKSGRTNFFLYTICFLMGLFIFWLYQSRIPGRPLIISFITSIVVISHYFLAKNKLPVIHITIMLIILAIGSYFIQVNSRLTRMISPGRVGAFHYFMGSKYFKELGYFGLYRYSLLADHESGLPRLRNLTHIRHLEDLSFTTVEKALTQAKKEKHEYFTEDRWKEFKSDWGPMVKASRQWKRKLNDHGFNPPPFWNFIPGFVAQHVNTYERAAYTAVRLIDLSLFVLILCGAAYYMGANSALLSYIFVNAAVVLYYPHGLVDSFLQFQWFLALIITMMLYRFGRMKLAGVTLAYATMLRIFPLVLIAGPGVVWLRKLIQERRLPKIETGFLVSFGIAATIFGLLGLTQGKGVASTRQFLQNITHHAESIKFDSNKFGLKRLMSVDLKNPLKRVRDNGDREKNFKNNRAVYIILWVLLIGLNIAAMASNIDDDAWVIPLGAGLIFAIMTASRYYYLMLIIFFIFDRKLRDNWFVMLSIAGIFLVHSSFIFYRGSGYGAFTLGNIGFLFAFILFPASLLIDKHFIQK